MTLTGLRTAVNDAQTAAATAGLTTHTRNTFG